ncbi:protein of unknown function [Xenorhabdus poinarii G6]|uniref:Uncharacterized protein n=1 Tax=Xenorhabdus poinarii G6 TaxID=1354304 RepID=A0A068R603_9GAMM|nr:hypothetical protein [Xenorhabdus poinarii]CDG22321.1 protein of unknown function [Xenorhabdus poinarii G6]
MYRVEQEILIVINFEKFNEQAALLAETLAIPVKVKTAYIEGLRYRLYEPEKAAKDCSLSITVVG